MVKTTQFSKNYLPLSKHESTLLNAIKDDLLFSYLIIKRKTGWKKSRIHNTLTSLKRKKKIIALKRDHYVLTENISEHIFKIAALLTSPSYISFWTACSYLGYTEQQVQSIQLVSTKQYSPLTINGHRIETVTVSPSRFFGYKNHEGFPIVEEEKLIIDMLAKPELSGGIEEITKCMKQMFPKIQEKKLNSYLKRYHNNSIYARLGYLVERYDLKTSSTVDLFKKPSSSIIKLNPKNPLSSKIDRKWGVNINDQ